jgi:hypothetical protein
MLNLRCFWPSDLTALVVNAAMHVELSPRRCEAVPVSGSRRGAEGVVGEVEPGHGGRTVYAEIVEACRDRDRLGNLAIDDARFARGFKRRIGASDQRIACSSILLAWSSVCVF